MEEETKSETCNPEASSVPEISPRPEDPLESKEEHTEENKEMDLADENANDKLEEESPLPENESLMETPKVGYHFCCVIQEEGEDGVSENQVGEGGNNIGRWSQQEHNQFLKGLELYGKDWRKISTIVGECDFFNLQVTTRTLIQIRTHAQKYFQKNDFGMKYDRVVEGGESSVDKRRFGGKVYYDSNSYVQKTKSRNHVRSNYQSTSKASNHPTHIIMTRSRAPSPIPEEKEATNQEEDMKQNLTIPPEFDPGEELEKHELASLPRHYNHSLRPSSMPLSSDDLFSRRITPLGVYYPQDRLKHEREFANCVMELLKKKAYEGEEKVEEVPKEEEKKEEVSKEEKKIEEVSKEEEKIEEVPKEGENKTAEVPKENERIDEVPKEEEKVEEVPKEKTEPVEEVKGTVTEETTDAVKVEKKKVTIIDQLKPPPSSVRPSLRITNPDSLLPLKNEVEDYRADLSAPKTPANVRGNRSILHRVSMLRVI